ncbi:MAG TPA: M56 family metallopeptidase [Candidatus Acidoferrales bacterium]|nr:M56 family metallopeptidase [Candidatus Acidoferrales bacterium]
MSALSAVRLDSALASYVVIPAVRSLALALAAWGLLKVSPIRDVSFRLAAWTAVLCAALAMPFLGQWMPAVPLPVPALRMAPASVPAPAVASPAPALTFASPGNAAAPAVLMPGVVDGHALAEASGPLPVTPARQSRLRISWLAVAAGGYFAIAGILLGRFVLGLVLSFRLRRSAQTISNGEVTQPLEREARKVGLRRLPRVGESGALSVPATLGVLRPMILLPPGWWEWSEGRTTAVLAHELSHIARNDPLRQVLGRLHRAIFWFSPLGWWLDRTLDELAEQASDDAALCAGADRERYAEALLDFFAALEAARGRVRWQAVPMARRGARSERRLERILTGGRLSHRLGQAGLATVVLAAAPLVCLAAAVHPMVWRARQALAVAPSVGAPPAAPAIGHVPEAPPALAQQKPSPPPPASPAAMPSPAPQAPAAPSAAPAPEPPAPPDRRLRSHRWMSMEFSCDDGQGYAVVSGAGSITECGSYEDIQHVRRLRSQISGGFVWFRKDGRSYIIRDPATVKAAVEAFAPQQALAQQQAELGRQQAALGGRQAALGMQQAGVRINIDLPDLTAVMKRVEEQLRMLDSSATQQALSQMQAQLGEMQSRMGALQAEAGKQEADLGRQQAALGEQQAKLGHQQAALGEQQAALARQAAARVRQLLEQALAKGLAKPE